MNNKDMQEILKQYPDDMPVMVQGYEGGYADVVSDGIVTANIFLNVNKDVSYVGNHVSSFPDEYEDDEYKSVEALVLLRDKFDPVCADEGIRKSTHKSTPEVPSGPISKVFYVYSTQKPDKPMVNFNGNVDDLISTIKQWCWHTSSIEAFENHGIHNTLWTIVLYCLPCDKTFNITEPQTESLSVSWSAPNDGGQSITK